MGVVVERELCEHFGDSKEIKYGFQSRIFLARRVVATDCSGQRVQDMIGEREIAFNEWLPVGTIGRKVGHFQLQFVDHDVDTLGDHFPAICDQRAWKVVARPFLFLYGDAELFAERNLRGRSVGKRLPHHQYAGRFQRDMDSRNGCRKCVRSEVVICAANRSLTKN